MGHTGSGYISQYGIVSEIFPGSDCLEGNMKTPSQNVWGPGRDGLAEAFGGHCWITLELLT